MEGSSEEDKLEKYYKWYNNEYNKISNIPSQLEPKFKEGFSSIWKHDEMFTMKYYCYLHRLGMEGVAVRLLRTGLSSIKPNKNIQYNSIIGYFYYTVSDKGKPDLKYICFGFTFNSADGEYRPFVTSYDQLKQHIKQNSDIFELYEEHALTQLKNQDIKFQTYVAGKHKDAINKHIDESRVLIYLYILNYMTLTTLYTYNIIPNHISPGYMETVFDGNLDKFNKIIKESGLNMPMMSRYSLDINKNIKPLEIGHKIRFVTVYEMENVGNTNLPTWRELKIASDVSDLVINCICSGFPLFDDWFLIKPNNVEYWNNKISITKFDHSQIASKTVRELEAARRNTFMLDPVNKQELYLSYKLENLSESINLPIDIAERDLVMSEYILVYFCEHTGTTFADLPRHVEINKTFNIFSDMDKFARCIFEYLYCFYCINTKLGVIHGDPHLNNVTYFGKMTSVYLNFEANGIKDPKVVYNIGDKYYVFPSVGKYGGLIDFSRSFINDKTTTNRLRMLHVIESELSTFYNDYKEQIYKLSYDDDFYDQFMFIDSYKLFRSMELFMEQLRLNPKMVTFVRNIKDTSLKYFTDYINGKKHELNPNIEIINKYFNEWIQPLDKIDGDILDYFSYENKLTYKCDNYKNYPPTIKLDYIEEHKLKTIYPSVINYKLQQKYLKTHKPDEEIEQLQKEELEKKAERRGETSTNIATKKEAENIEEIMSSGVYF